MKVLSLSMYEDFMRRLSISMLNAAMLLAVLLASYMPVGASEWRLAKNKGGIKIFIRPVQGSNYDAFKGVTKISTSFKKLLGVLADTPSNCRWMHQCGKPTILKQVSFKERYIYQINYLPAPLWNRDIIMHSKATINEKGDEVMVRLKAAPHFCEFKKLRSCRNLDQTRAGRDFVRITKAQGFYRLRKLSDSLVEVTWQMHAEPGGEVWGWMVNANLVEIPFETLKGLKSFIGRSKNKKIDLKLASR
ncbi:MAG: hypothetical protein GY927_07580 [bacterium]|nr:hypothetical protein [bacterium]